MRDLNLLTCRFHNSFQDHHNFKLLSLHGALGELIKGAFTVNHMTDGEGRHQEELICPSAETHI